VGNRRAKLLISVKPDVAYEQWLQQSYVPFSGKTNYSEIEFHEKIWILLNMVALFHRG